MCDGDKPVLTDPQAIEAESFHIIDHELSPHFRFTPAEHAVVRRVIHATADFEFARNLRFSPDCFEAFEKAWKAGAGLVCDVAMVQAGVSRSLFDDIGDFNGLALVEASIGVAGLLTERSNGW